MKFPLRSRGAALVAAALLAIFLAGTVATQAQAKPIIGFNDFWSRNLPLQLANTRSLGATSNRIFVNWDIVEQSRGRYNWAALDVLSNAMIKGGQRPLYVVVGSPAWSKDPSCTDLVPCPQAASADGAYDAFVQALVKRYPQAMAVEIGNEVNLTSWWRHPNPVRYTQILKGAYKAIKAANPQMTVLSGALCPGPRGGIAADGSYPPGLFLQKMYDNGVKGSFDGLGYHVYVGSPVGLTAPSVKEAMDQVRNSRDANDDNKPFWITETGFPSTENKNAHGDYNETTQAQRLSIDYRVLASMPDVAAVYFFNLTDFAGDEGTMGVYHQDFTPKPALEALREAMAAPPWPNYQVKLIVPSSTRSLQPFNASAVGYTGSEPAAYRWLLWYPGDAYPNRVLATTYVPNATLQIKRRVRYILTVQVVTAADVFMSPGVKFRVTDTPAQQAKKKPKRKARRSKKHAKHAKHKPAVHGKKHPRARR